MAGRVFFTGDIHGEYGIKRFTARAWPLGKTLDKQDYLIILWDFGLVFSLDKQEDYWLNWLDARPWTTLFIDGNHENFPALLTYPVTDNFGGPAGVLRPSVMHLRKRGHIYTVAGRKFWCFGGALSTDKSLRTEGVSWWPQEEASGEEMDYGLRQLKEADGRVDCILSHDCPAAVARAMFAGLGAEAAYVPSRTGRYLEEAAGAAEGAEWYFGHYHLDKSDLPAGVCGPHSYRCLYVDIVEKT